MPSTRDPSPARRASRRPPTARAAAAPALSAPRALSALLALLALAAAPPAARAAAPALTPPHAEVLAEARQIVESMKQSERGPYARLRWFCKDGTVLPPAPYACQPHGGGRQHGEYSDARRRLAELGWSVGTVVAALSWEEVWDAGRRNRRLRELPLERYLVEVDDGWVLRRARFYRGRVQIEDEEAVGRELLVKLLSRPEWVRENFLLARESVRVLPHSGGGDRTRAVRRLAQEIAEKDGSFERLRIKIHTTPGPEDVRAVRDWIDGAKRKGASAPLLEAAGHLADGLKELYGEPARALAEARRGLARHPKAGQLALLLDDAPELAPAGRVDRYAAALALIREAVVESADGASNLRLLDLSLLLEEEAVKAAFAELAEPDPRRSDLLDLADRLVDAAYGGGLLSERERDALAAALDPVIGLPEAPTSGYLEAIRGLKRAGGWGLGAIRHAFGEPLVSYAALEPKAARFPDDLLRGSAMLPLAEATTRLAADADAVTGLVHRIFGATYGGMLALNPGVATGPLKFATSAASDAGPGYGREDVVVLPTTVAELDPVSGILTLAEGNLLSHVQILARNLGIPNASISPILERRLVEHQGERVLFAVGTRGSILLERLEDLPPAVAAALGVGGGAPLPAAAGGRVEAPVPDLAVQRPLPLAELHAGLAGRVVGPKAANLGELARTFPGRVSPAIALPFGIFAKHVGRGPDPPKARLDRAFARHRAGELDAAGLAAEVEAVRRAIAGLALDPGFRAELAAMVHEEFGPPGDYGAFVRSDTNVEDLPGFTGAGLNETVPNLVGFDAQAAAIPRVWSSPFRERAMAWRSQILARPEEVYTSILLMKSVPADKSGVLVTADLATRGEGLTVATSWGVGGAVDGEAAETLVLRPDGTVTLVGEAKAPYRRRLAPGGGVDWVPAPAGQVLTTDEREALRRLAAEVDEKLVPAKGADGRPLPWDIEFGFVAGELTLFQIRPLVERGQLKADRILEPLVAGGAPPPQTRLDAPLARPQAEPAS